MKIKTLNLLSADLDGTANFYHAIIGLPMLERNENSIAFQAGHSVLKFTYIKDQQPTYHFAFNIPCNQIDEALAWMKDKAEIIPETASNVIADFKNWNAKAFYFYDNNQNILEFIARFDLHNESERPFTGGSIVSISEGGIPVNNVQQTCDNLRKRYRLNYFTKQTPLQGFAAVGDDEGLLIIVDINRNWYPTQQPSAAFYLKVEAITEQELVELTYHQ